LISATGGELKGIELNQGCFFISGIVILSRLSTLQWEEKECQADNKISQSIKNGRLLEHTTNQTLQVLWKIKTRWISKGARHDLSEQPLGVVVIEWKLSLNEQRSARYPNKKKSPYRDHYEKINTSTPNIVLPSIITLTLRQDIRTSIVQSAVYKKWNRHNTVSGNKRIATVRKLVDSPATSV